MSSIFAVVWRRLLGPPPGSAPRSAPPTPSDAATLPGEEAASSTMFLMLRRMRASLNVLIIIYAVSVLGLTLIPGVDGQGAPWHMGFFHAFYFMSYTATTIGFGEIPYAFTHAQRLWVTLCIYLTVIGWAYAIGTLLGLLQDRGFRQAMAVQRFARHGRRIREPYYLIAGYGQTGRLLGHALAASASSCSTSTSCGSTKRRSRTTAPTFPRSPRKPATRRTCALPASRHAIASACLR